MDRSLQKKCLRVVLTFAVTFILLLHAPVAEADATFAHVRQGTSRWSGCFENFLAESIVVDSALEGAWDHLVSVRMSSGQAVGRHLCRSFEQTGAYISVGPLPAGVNGEYRRDSNSITISPATLQEDTRVIATVLAHEMGHATEVHSGLYDWERHCVEMEVASYMLQASIWGYFVQEMGYWPTKTPLERMNNHLWRVLDAQGPDGFDHMIRNDPSYRTQCHIQ